MKAISIRQPFAWAIVHANKRIENRARRGAPSYRGPILIHAAKGCARAEYEDGADAIDYATAGRLRCPPLQLLYRGGFVGRARLVEVVRTTDGGHRVAIAGDVSACALCVCGPSRRASSLGPPALDTCPNQDPWAIPGTLGLILTDVEPLPFVPWRGALGLFDADPPEYRGMLGAL